MLKVGLGTSWGFGVREGPHGRFWMVVGGLPAGIAAFRIAPNRYEPARYDVDMLPKIGPWEDYAAGQTFATPEEAAAFLVAKVRV